VLSDMFAVAALALFVTLYLLAPLLSHEYMR